MFKVYLNWFFCILILTRCSSKNPEDYKREARRTMASLTQEFENIHSRKDILAAQPRLKKLFYDLATTAVAAQELKEKQNVTQSELTNEDHELSEQLRVEMSRVYKIEGAKSMIEKTQEEALFLLMTKLDKN